MDTSSPRAAVANAGYGPVVIPAVLLGAVLLCVIFKPDLIIEKSMADFIVVSIMIAGWAAWRAGQSIAQTWRPYSQVVLYMLPFGLVVRWVHYALFGGTLLSLQFYLVDAAIVLSFATIGYRVVRARQMATQYRWLYTKTGLVTWARASGT